VRYPKGHVDATRKRILKTASRRFRKEGLERAGIADLMKAVGLTHGGFYFHFDSKEDLVREAMNEAFDQSGAKYVRRGKRGQLEAIVRGYLAPATRDKPENGCAAAALVAEIARHPVSTRRAFMAKLDHLFELIGAQLQSNDAGTRRRCAIGIFAVMMGTLQLARAEPNPTRSRQILKSGIDAALVLGRSLQITPESRRPKSAKEKPG
jgi:TetR/AcrR family transcriptional regulator, transcriptional repressor for nem operon